jgi:hypothetical protein
LQLQFYLLDLDNIFDFLSLEGSLAEFVFVANPLV